MRIHVQEILQDAEETSSNMSRILRGIPEDTKLDLLKRAPFFAALVNSKKTLDETLAVAKQTQLAAESIRSCLLLLLNPEPARK